MTEQIPGATKAQVTDYLMRHKRYDNIDGTGEMFCGVMYLAFALEGYVTAALPQDKFWQKGLGQFLVMFGILIPVFGLVGWGVKVIKRRITWPRTGYMALRKITRSSILPRMAAPLVAAVLVTGLFLAVVRYGRLHNAALLPQMLWIAMYAAPYALVVSRLSREHPWKRFVALFLAASLIAYTFAWPEGPSRPVMIFTGLVWLASGGVTLYLYIRRTEPPAPESE